ncbi:uncharacterized protein Eint_110990 [Encephalitozoon intestinalis ATCC 50506]|uniref:Uncharacterized protein n=1 Tax=Encephalitozoon intestinalis (strain ATCC 50506) TaxID=876142 RepID=E0S9X7_ENCIT|nr:uncharacterized protein Eint_110990 [Encephalitozoon intestinalis ATCC 50506]ADM12599.1 hypothetical protein Eint_110990 [Encephalitozoon intestinalis ATCC 50506]UTX46456.1 hypothetical protein GPK93_11g20660 [Encephalitozoon intestinalis]
MRLFAEDNGKKPFPPCENTRDVSLGSPDTSQQLGKYIVNGLEMLSLSDIKVVVDEKKTSLDSVSSESPDTLSGFGSLSGESNEDCVYLPSIYKTYVKVSEKIDRLIKGEYFSKEFVKCILREVCRGNLEGARSIICQELQERDPFFSPDTYLVESGGWNSVGELSRRTHELMEDLKEIEEISHKLHRIFFEMRSRSFEAELGYAKATGEFVKQLDKCSREMEGMRKINGLVSKDITEAAEDFGVDVDIRDDDLHGVQKALRSVFKEMRRRIKNMESSGLEVQQKEKEHEKVLRDYLELKKGMDGIKAENSNFSEAVAKLSSKNSKIRRDYDTLRETLKRTLESSKRKSITIDRQKKIIDILQSRVGDGYVLPVNELQSKIDEIKRRADAEPDSDKKRRLEDEITDYERRMSDFISLMNRVSK